MWPRGLGCGHGGAITTPGLPQAVGPPPGHRGGRSHGDCSSHPTGHSPGLGSTSGESPCCTPPRGTQCARVPQCRAASPRPDGRPSTHPLGARPLAGCVVATGRCRGRPGPSCGRLRRKAALCAPLPRPWDWGTTVSLLSHQAPRAGTACRGALGLAWKLRPRWGHPAHTSHPAGPSP